MIALFIVAASTLIAPRLRTHADQTLPISSCDPGVQTCTASLPDGGTLEFSVAPQPPRALTQLQLTAALSNAGENRIEVAFTGSEMEMGEARAPLTAVGRRFGGQAMLPVCASGTMQWLATVIVTREGHRTAVPFRFEVAGPRRG